MKNSTLQSIANKAYQDNNNTWTLLNNIAISAGDDKAAGTAKVLDFVVAVGLRNTLEAWHDKSENIDKDIRSFLSRLNEEYPFDVGEANHRVKSLLSKYIDMTMGFNTYAQALATMELLTTTNNAPVEVDETLTKAWSYL